ncbi:unnamed protein product [Rotaria socialis]|uniref:Retrotransposon gag domain-containing protein n=2 Tax=Rotaria socialis TaxID=392032 RepID=A0A821SR77_9BILA|nr:unnamed protein product [Rotaria socialis]
MVSQDIMDEDDTSSSFSSHSSEYLPSFLCSNSIVIRKTNQLNENQDRLLMYDNNKETLRSWRELKQHLLERFKPSLSTAKTQLKERKQQAGETLIAYYDDIIDLCKQVDNNVPLHMIADYLQDGLRQELKIHAKRQVKALNDEPTPAIFLKISRDEEELQHGISSEQQPSITPPQPYCVCWCGCLPIKLHPHPKL